MFSRIGMDSALITVPLLFVFTSVFAGAPFFLILAVYHHSIGNDRYPHFFIHIHMSPIIALAKL
ncbi:hypothetical protein CGH87_06675 [Vibrio parahaemolyticus]|nr:hypothetical protein [Vibrio parahaemolyticus]EGR3303051.1 hypothetical protein [Vibrio parahaemolyticus]EGR3318168.1 hypothetical protein [Vibrio parahaemolyticus]TOE45370.1 hypothetical protein CGJ45_02135 [Vibrio parahaemolyticus]TOM01189.1 hypothetical protein CGH87_06675 [Vibrio parahaemolyticus]